MLKPEGTLLASERTQLADFYRHQITKARTRTAQLSWRQQLTALLDYRLWHTFKLQAKHAQGPWQTLTKRVHGQMSGGEKAVALHMPLFAAAATHCEASKIVVDGEDGPMPGCPRLILLDEVFAGVDTENRGALFDLVRRLDLDLVATSESEQGLYPELNGLSIYQLIVDDASRIEDNGAATVWIDVDALPDREQRTLRWLLNWPVTHQGRSKLYDDCLATRPGVQRLSSDIDHAVVQDFLLGDDRRGPAPTSFSTRQR